MTWSVNLSRISGGQKVKKLSGEGLLPPSRSLPSAADMDGPASWGMERRRPSKPLISWCLLPFACCSTPIFVSVEPVVGEEKLPSLVLRILERRVGSAPGAGPPA